MILVNLYKLVKKQKYILFNIQAYRIPSTYQHILLKSVIKIYLSNVIRDTSFFLHSTDKNIVVENKMSLIPQGTKRL